MVAIVNPITKTWHNPWAEAYWELFDYTFYTNKTKADRKNTIRKMIAWGITARQAIALMQDTEREP